MTAFCGAEALINSRPLTYQSADIKDIIPFKTQPLLTWPNERRICPRGVGYDPKRCL